MKHESMRNSEFMHGLPEKISAENVRLKVEASLRMNQKFLNRKLDKYRIKIEKYIDPNEEFTKNEENVLIIFNQLSTEKKKVGEVSQNSLRGNCGRFSRELQNRLKTQGLETVMYGGLSHTYLSVERGMDENNIVIDATIGQFIEGHNQVFVGTRKELLETLRVNANSNKLVNFWTLTGDKKAIIDPKDVDEFYNNHWCDVAEIKLTQK